MGSFLNFVGVVAIVHGHDDGIGVKRVKLKSEVEDYVRFVSVCAVKRLAACEKKEKSDCSILCFLDLDVWPM